jgi:hypothetical protein
MKKHSLKYLTVLIVLMSVQQGLLAQSYDPTGPISNLCPGVTYRYTSPIANNGGPCDQSGGWICTGCLNPSNNTETIIGSGMNANGTVWADVKWKNTTSGRIGNFCGNIPVSINAIAQTTMSGPSTVLLCGTGSLTLQATVSSTTNISGYAWLITGTGVSPTGSVNTTVPQLTINFTNWTAASTLSATVAVGAKNACGFNTPLTPLVTQNPLPGVTFPAIPRTTWVQLSPGNIDNLLAPLSFSTPLICTTGVMAVSNQPANTNLVWSSGNTSALTVDPATGAATRVNNFNGSVTVSATVSNACGASTQNTSVWLGFPSRPGDISGNTTPSVGGIYQYSSSSPAQGAAYHNWTLPFGGNPVWSQSGGNINGIIDTLTPNLIVGSSSGRLQAFGVNACGNGPVSRLNVSPTGGGGGGIQQRVAFPNPASQVMTVKLKEDESKEEANVALLNKNMEPVFFIQTSKSEISIPVGHLPEGNYFLKIQIGSEVTNKQIVVKH